MMLLNDIFGGWYMFNTFLVAEQVTPTSSGSLLMSGILMLVLFGILYFLMIRPQRKQEKKQREQRDALQVGDKIVTIGGIVGKVVNLSEDEFTITTSPASTLITLRKDALSGVLKEE